MVEVIHEPFPDKAQLAEIHNEAIRIQLPTGKDKLDVPIVPMNEPTMPVMQMLAMRKGYIGINFRAGVHSGNY